jgi:hypothetical protein
MDDYNVQLILEALGNLDSKLSSTNANLSSALSGMQGSSLAGLAERQTGPVAPSHTLPSLLSPQGSQVPSMVSTSMDRQELAALRTDLSRVRSAQSAGILPPELNRQISSQLDEMLSKVKREISGKFEDLSKATDAEAQQEILIEIEGTSALVQELQATKNTLGQSTDRMSKSIIGVISSFVSAMAVQQYIMMRTVQQPYQYQTLPALSAMGNTGMMGEVMSGAYGAQESVLQSYRSMTVQGSMAGFGALGAAALRGLGPGGLLLGGVAGTLAGGAIGNFAKDGVAGLLAGGMDDKAFNMELGKRILNPQQYAQNFFMPTLQARMGLGLGLGENTAAAELSGLTSIGAKALGYDAVTSGQLIGSYLSTLSPNLVPRTQAESAELLDRTAQLESFGMSKDMVMGVFGEISRAGSEDYDRSLGRLLFATSENGEITNFTANVLVPALSRVVESRAIQNIAKSSEQVERETAGLFSFFKNSGTNLGTMLSANPEMMNQVFGMLNQVGETALQDPALMLYLNRMGLSFSDVVTGDPRALMLPMQAFAQQAQYKPDGSIDLDSAASVSSVVGFLTMSGIGVNLSSFNLAAQMMEALKRGDVTGAESISEQLELQSTEGILRQLVERLDTIATSAGGETMINIVEQTNRFYELMEDHMAEMNELQTTMISVLSNTESIAESVKSASEEMIRQIQKITGTAVEDWSSDEGILVGTPAGVPVTPIGSSFALEEGRNAELLAHTTLLGMNQPSTYGIGRDFRVALVNTDTNETFTRTIGDLETTMGANWWREIGLSGNPTPSGFATGGFTGMGSRLDPVGVVHGGEYVISDNNVTGNRNTLERMQSGERFDEMSSFGTTQMGDTIRVTLEFSNVNPEEIINAAKISARKVLYDERLI